MTVVDWVVVGLFASVLVVNLVRVGKPLKPAPPEARARAAAVGAVVDVVLIVAILWSHGVLSR